MRYYSFWDMHSGGHQKLDHPFIVIEAETEDQAVGTFRALFKRSPYNVTCGCCGGDYSISEEATVAGAVHDHARRGESVLFVDANHTQYVYTRPS